MFPRTQARQRPLQYPTPELRQAVIEQIESVLLKIVRANIHTQYASKTPLLAEFREAVSTHGSVLADASLVNDFRRCVPLSDYDAYKPFMIAFDQRPCKEAELDNLFAPGVPYLLALSSATSGREPKMFPKYNSYIPSALHGEGPVAAMLFYGYRELKPVERGPGEIVKRIPVSTASSGVIRTMLGWTNVDDDDDRMPTLAPGFVAPFAASMISHHKSFLTIHALFALARRDTDRLILTFSTVFYDLVRYVDEQWDMLLSSIKKGTIPDLPGTHDVHAHLQSHLHADPDRAAELVAIGPPFSCTGWAACVWPKLRSVTFGCGGPFASVLPKVKAVLGPTIVIQPNIYASSESDLGFPYSPDDPHTFVLWSRNVIEFLDVTAEASHEHLVQAWEVEVGKKYEVVLTTKQGLWRYRLGDVLDVVGFDATSGLPVFVLSGRRSLALRLTPALISDADIVAAVQSLPLDVAQVTEFTTVLDERQAMSTVGYLIELAGAPGPNAHLAAPRLTDGLAAANTKYRMALEEERARIPTVRILKSGTFAAFRQWRAEKMSIGPGQVKVPVVLLDGVCREWILEWVIGEV